jgi:signal transduction histidine kinase
MEHSIATIRRSFKARPVIWDSGIAAVLAGIAVLGVLTLHPVAVAGGEGPPSLGFSTAFAAGLMAPLAIRRRTPLTALAAYGALFAALRWLEVPEVSVSSMGLALAIVSAGIHGGSRRTMVRGLVVAGLLATVVYATFFTDLTDVPTNVQMIRAFNLSLNIAFLGAAWVLGDMIRRTNDYKAELETRTVQLEHERELNASRAVIEERLRIARELHDVVAHHVSVMGVQAGAARTVMSKAPDRAAETLASIEETSRTAVSEMHRMLGMLRQTDDTDSTSPQPSLERLDELIDSMRIAGIGVESAISGNARQLSPMVDLSAYRIVQEALTNTVKHAGPAKALVHIDYGPTDLEISVTDDGRGAAWSASGRGGSGNGILGMRERTQLCGGTLDAGPKPGGGYRVRAVLPIGGR